MKLNNTNTHLVPTELESKLYETTKLYADKRVLFYNKEFTNIPVLRKNQLLLITSDDEIKEGDLVYDLNTNSVEKAVLFYLKSYQEDVNISKIIASSSPLITPNHLISDTDIQYCADYWNKNKELPSGELFEGICFPDVNKKVLKTENDQIIIEWENTQRVIQTSTDSEPKEFIVSNIGRPLDFHHNRKIEVIETWQPTMNLRWHEYESLRANEINRTLQQQYLSNLGATEWRNVETVNN